MSKKHPIIAVTGSSGAGTTTVKVAFEHVFRREGITAVFIEGDSFHRSDRVGMTRAIADAEAEGRNISHFGPEANLLGLTVAETLTYVFIGLQRGTPEEQDKEPPPGSS